MKIRAFSNAALFAAAMLFTAGNANAAEWGTTYGQMTLPDELAPGPVRAPYSEDGGRLIGRFSAMKCNDCGIALTGIWVENGSDETCDSVKDGSAHWGAATLEFNDAHTSFTGTWNYCGKGASHAWTGKLGAMKRGASSR